MFDYNTVLQWRAGNRFLTVAAQNRNLRLPTGAARNRRHVSFVAALGLLAALAAGQGPAVRNQVAAHRPPLSGRPFPVTLTDIASEAGLRMKSVDGGETSKRYIIEANGAGVAFLDYDNDGRQDIFVVNGSRLE